MLLQGQAAKGSLGQVRTGKERHGMSLCSRFLSELFPQQECSRPQESEAVTAEQHSRESIRIARTTRRLEQGFEECFREGFLFDCFAIHPVSAVVLERANVKFSETAGGLELQTSQHLPD